MDDPRGVSRRALLLSAGVGIGAVTVDGARKPLLAQADRPTTDQLWSAEYVARKGDVSLALYRKRIGPPQAGERPVLFLVHGSSVSAKPRFDLTVPGRGEYSLMNVFAGYGFDVWTMDHEGYGKSARTAGNSDVASGVEDLKAASEVVVRETAQPRAHFYGGSSGALRAAGFAMARPERVDRLILEAFTWTGKGSPTLGKRAEQIEYFRTHNRRPRGRDMIRSIFTRDKPGTSDPAVAEALADAELQFGDTIPTGTYLDMTTNLPVVDPLRVKSPVLMVRGEYDGIATEEDLLEFFRRLPNLDRQFIVLAGGSHSVGLGLTRAQLWHVIRAFLTMPAA
jgi:alpha-beta hydrolase superfamily lysophospholipase